MLKPDKPYNYHTLLSFPSPFSPFQDVAQTASELPQVALNHRVEADYNHLDFLWAENANEMVYRPALAFLDAFYWDAALRVKTKRWDKEKKELWRREKE